MATDENGNKRTMTGAERRNNLYWRRRDAGLCATCGADAGGAFACPDCKVRIEKATATKDRLKILRERRPHDAVVEGVARPKTRAECPEGPCPWVGCRHHLAILRITPHGKIILAFPDLEDVTDMEETCSLRAAELGPHQYHAIGRKVGLAEEYVEVAAFDGLRRLSRNKLLTDAGFVVPEALRQARLKRMQTTLRNHRRSIATRNQKNKEAA
jgi:hypothetical protein